MTVGGSYPNGEEIEKTELMQDSDQINISVEEKSEQATDSSSYRRTDPTDRGTVNHPRSYDREEKTSSSVKTGDRSQPEKYMILAALSLLVILIISMIYRKSRK